MKISEDQIRRVIESEIKPGAFTGKSILVLTPDATRTCPLPLMVRLLNEAFSKTCSRLDFMVALGTHMPLEEGQILDLYGIDNTDRKFRFSKSVLMNHRWDLADTLVEIGVIEKEEISRLSGSKMSEAVPVVINRKIFEYDLILILGPVFPHEVVGFSGGAKYMFPGISGGDFLHFFHWLGAVLTCKKIIGEKSTPVRQVIERALRFMKVPVLNLSMVVGKDGELHGLFGGDIGESWSRAADLSAQMHIEYRKGQYQTVLGCAPEMYDEIWTAGKVMYKLEQMVERGGDLIIYGPHIAEISKVWGREITEIGYHVRDYFLMQMEKFRHIPRGILAHSTHVKGDGVIENGREVPNVNVILATSISKEVCGKVNLGYMDYRQIKLDDYKEKENEGILFVEKAGETLYKLRT